MRDADGRIRAFGTTTINPGELVADAEHVAWIANDCLLVAPVTAARATVPGPGGPCPRSELQVLYNSPLKAARTLPVKLQCVAAPTRCRGTVRFAGYSAKHRFDIASGHTGTLRRAAHPRAQAPRPDGIHGRGTHRRRRAVGAAHDRPPMIVPIAHEPVQATVLAGDTVLVATGHKVVAFPQRTVVFTTPTGDISLAASPVRAAAVVQTDKAARRSAARCSARGRRSRTRGRRATSSTAIACSPRSSPRSTSRSSSAIPRRTRSAA